MTDLTSSAALQQALAVSRELLRAAEDGDGQAAVRLAGTRLELLRTARAGLSVPQSAVSDVIDEIAKLNDRTIGAMEHRLRAKVREFDLASVGRRAVEAYAVTRGRS